MQELNWYVRSIRTRALAWDEQLPLWKKYAKTKDPKIERRLWEANLGLVPAILLRTHPFKMMCDLDMVQECNAALLKAVQKFNVKRGFRFATYAVWWIKAYAQKYLKEKRGNGMGVGPKTAPPPVMSLDAEVSEDGSSFLDHMDGHVDSPEKEFLDLEEKYQVQQCMSMLMPKEQEILKRRLWEEETLQMVGDSLGFSRERARQLEMRGLQKMERLLNGEVVLHRARGKRGKGKKTLARESLAA